MISRHMEGQESSELDPCQGKIQKDLDFVHIPMYVVLVVRPAYIHDYRFKSHMYHFSHVLKMVQWGIRSLQWDRGSPYKV